MKFLVLLSCIALAAAERSYSIYGGYKEQGKYVYHYEAFLYPSAVPNLEKHVAKIHINGTVELHIMKNEKAILKVKDISIYECLSDPKNMSGVNERFSEFSTKLSRPHLMKPIKFGYTNGLVQQVFAPEDDPSWSVNIKKGILNMLSVDVQGKDQETGLKDFFNKEEATILGICQTSYSHKYFEVVDARQVRRRIGMNFTKTIDFENCTGLNYDIYNKVVQGRNPDQDSNPLKTTATIKYNITGTETQFKIEGVTAQGVYVLYPFSKQEEGIPSRSLQTLVLLKEGVSHFESEYPHHFAWNQRGKLMMEMPSFHKPEVIPPLSQSERKDKATYICNAIKRFSSLIPKGKPVQSVILQPEISTIFMQVVNNLRMCDLTTLSGVWAKCADQDSRKWHVYALSLCHTETCMESMRSKVESVKEEDILTYLQGISFIGQPTRSIVNRMEKLCSIPKIANNLQLLQACWISSSNIAQGYCKVNPICTSWIENAIRDALQKISKPECYQNIENCQPIKGLTVHTVVSIAENHGRPSYLAALESIIFHPEVPTSVKMHAINCLRPIIRQSPRRVQIVLLRLFRDFKYDSQMRTLALSVIMENPHPHLIQLCARQIYVEPSLNIRKFAHELFTQCSESVIKYNRTIRHTCKSVLKLYTKLYLPSPMAQYRSLHMNGQLQNQRLNLASELEGSWIANNNSYIPRYSQARMRTSVLGRKFEVFDSQMYMQGIQDYVNWLIHSMQEYIQPQSEELLNIKKKIYDITERTSHVPKDPEELLYEGRLRLFDKLVSVQNITLDKTSDFTEQLYSQLPQLLQIFKQLKEGKTWMWTQPFMPVETVYQVPSLCGVPLVFNMSSMILPYSRTNIKLETTPDIKSPMSLIRTKLQEIKVSGIQQFNSLAEVRGTIKYRLPFIEVGAQCRKVMNMSTHMEGSMKYNFKTGEYNEHIQMPKDMREVFFFNMEAYHYIKTTKEPMRKLDFEPDQFGRVQIINVTQPCEGHCRAEEWIIRTTTGKYLSVQDGKIVLKPQPFKFKVIFHGVNRRIISLYVPDQGYVVMSKKSPCLFVKPTSNGKYFIVDYENLQNTLIKALVHLEKVPEGWGLPPSDEIQEIENAGSLFMQEQVVITGEEYIERELIEPSKQYVRMAYLALTDAPKVCLTPKRQQALNFTTERQTNFTTLLDRYSYSNRSCIGQPWGFNLCLHGYFPVSIARSPISLLCSPSKFRVTCRPDNTTKVTSIDTRITLVKNTTTEWTYKSVTRLTGTTKTITANVNFRRTDNKFQLKVTPSDPMLLRMKKLCYDEQFQPDNYSLRVSVDDKECKKVHLKADFLAPKQLPRHQMAFRYNFTTEGIPSFWRQALWYTDLFVMRPILRYSSDYWYSNMTGYQNLTRWNFNATINGTTYLQYLLTSNDTLTYKIVSPTEVWVWEKVKLTAFINTFPKGSKHLPIVFKLMWSKGKACCQHRNSTFITHDKNVFNYTMKRGCDHVLLRSCYRNMTQLMVLAARAGPEGSMRKKVTTLVDTYEIEFIPGKQYTDQPIVKINGKQITLADDKYEIWKEGKPCLVVVWEPEIRMMAFWHAQTQLWVSLQNGYKVHTSVSPMLFGKVCGLCGNFNGEQRFEFRTPEGKLIRDVQRPKLYDPELAFYEERHFGNSWIVPGRKCAKGECNFRREFIKVEQQNKYCLTKIRVPQCQTKCTTKTKEDLKAPVICVAKNESSQLHSQLVSGQPLTLATATDHLLPVSLPIECNCPCKNRSKYFKGDEEEEYKDEKKEYDSKDYSFNLFDTLF
ncbi:vitellogenin-1-like [Rhopilema esculentum]|uniref:vitellogenin-1-like n=1 Tax=Rhopilema esculentum TaxID=499914 RepID=UPI0031D90B5D|eukprot:gene4569-20833_t